MSTTKPTFQVSTVRTAKLADWLEEQVIEGSWELVMIWPVSELSAVSVLLKRRFGT